MTQTVLLGDVARIKGGKRLPKGEALQGVPNSHPYLRIVDMGQKYVARTSLQYVPDDVFPKISKYITNTDDILLSIVGTIGMVSIVDKNLDNASLTENCVKLICDRNKIDPEFLYYFLSSSTGQAEIQAGRVGSTQPKLPLYNIAKIKLPGLNLDQQRAIVGVLGSIDEKIELNRKMNETLEEMGQALFRHYFIDNPEVLKWDTVKIAELVSIKGGGTPSTKEADFWSGDIAWTSPRDLTGKNDAHILSTDKTITEKGLAKISSGLLPEGTLLLSSRAPIGYVAIAGLPLAINQGYIAFLAGAYLSNHFMYFWLKHNMEQIKNAANGSTFMEISKSAFRNINITKPSKKSLQEFETEVASLFDAMRNNQEQIQTLTTLRDTLLPRLISGKVKVN